jgi:putative transposase
MKKSNQKSVSETVCGFDNPEIASESSASREVRDVPDRILREGAQKMLPTAIQQEVHEYRRNRASIVGEDGRRLVIRNGSLPERELLTGVGAIQLRQFRVRDKRPPEEREVVSSSILPKYLRRWASEQPHSCQPR